MLYFYVFENKNFKYWEPKPMPSEANPEDEAKMLLNEINNMDETTRKNMGVYQVRFIGVYDNTKGKEGLKPDNQIIFDYDQAYHDMQKAKEFKEKQDGKKSA